MKLDEEQEKAVGLMMSGRNVFLTGEAGTGKSTVLREFVRRRGEGCIVLTPTGIAAVNSGGCTIHSLFSFKPGLLDPMALGPLADAARYRVLRNAGTIIIDEISMVRSDLFCAVDARLRELSGKEHKRRPFGGRQVVAVGDFMQLPPVVKSGEESVFLRDRLGGEFAFQTDLWQAAKFRTVFLRTLHRQGGDPAFRNVLRNIRRGEMDSAGKVLNNHCAIEKGFDSPPICLCTTNKDAKVINDMEMKSLTGASCRFEAQVEGDFPECDFPAESRLDIAVGARVMVLRNLRKDDVIECANGEMGVVAGFDEDEHSVSVRLDGGRTVVVTPSVWEKTAYVQAERDGKTVMERKVVGTFTQIPLRPAYAITIHKSQGLSFDNVFLRLGRGCFDHGQLYTALSRCRTLAGLRIDRKVSPEDLQIAGEVVRFCTETENADDVPDDGGLWYEEAMEYYLRRIETGNGEPPPGKEEQAEFDFEPRIYSDSVLSELCRLYEVGKINKYDMPILKPLVKSVAAGVGVRPMELDEIRKMIAKYRYL